MPLASKTRNYGSCYYYTKINGKWDASRWSRWDIPIFDFPQTYYIEDILMHQRQMKDVYTFVCMEYGYVSNGSGKLVIPERLL